jgi:hypothetical protein
MCTSSSLDPTLLLYKDHISNIQKESAITDSCEHDCEDIELNNTTIKARNKLVNEIRTYANLSNEKTIVSERMTQFVKNVSSIEDILAFMSNTGIQMSVDENYIQDNMDNIQYSLGNIKDSVLEKLNDELFAIDSKLSKSGNSIKKLGDAFDIFRTLSYSYLCCICLQNNVDVFASPCGHTFCNTCLKSTFCYFCRKKVDTVKKIYFNL